jgi:glycosyltransferase involved in cell wall biosynthesis
MATDLDAPAGPPAASIVVPTRARLGYLEVALASLAPQAAAAGAELIVVDDDRASASTRALCERFGARCLTHSSPLGLNHARNTAIAAASGDLIVFVDDDIEARDGWLAALLGAAREHPEVEVFTGPIRARLEGSPPRSCGRERPPITSLELGEHDTLTRFAWGANMAIRRTAFERIGRFDPAVRLGGDEQEWQERLWAERGEPAGQAAVAEVNMDGPTRAEASGGPGGHPAQALYVAAAALDHRRDADDSRLRALCRAAFARGRAARRFDAWRGRQPRRRRELWTLLACCGHVVRRRCPAGLTMVAHSAGRLREALARRDVEAKGGVEGSLARQEGPSGERTPPPFSAVSASAAFGASTPSSANTPPFEADYSPFKEKETHTPPYLQRSPAAGESAQDVDDFLSGESGTVGGLDELRRAAIDARDDALQAARARALRLGRAARRSPAARRVLALCVERPQNARLADAIAVELARSRHRVELRRSHPGTAGKFENLNRLLAPERLDEFDWLLVLDDDISLPRAFLDRFLFLAERFALDLAQPAHRARSHAAWRVTRRRRGAVVRETRFVEIGPVTAFARRTYSTLLPFPPLRMGWGLDLHWAALAAEHGWRCGVIDAVAIGHRQAPAATAYSREQALAEARSFLRERPYLCAAEAQRTLATHRRW